MLSVAFWLMVGNTYEMNAFLQLKRWWYCAIVVDMAVCPCSALTRIGALCASDCADLRAPILKFFYSSAMHLH